MPRACAARIAAAADVGKSMKASYARQPMSLTRRDLLRLAGLGAAGLAGVTACGDNVLLRAPGGSHAAMIHEPAADSFVISVWSSLARALAVEVRAGDAIVYSAVSELVHAETAAIEIAGLEPGQRYQVTITTDDGVLLGPHQVRTAPAADDPRPVRIAVSADIDPYPLFRSDILEQMARTNPELFVSLGDFPYADNGPGPALTRAEYRQRHVEARTEPVIRSWLQSVGIRAIYDDHEVRNDWDAVCRAEEPARYTAAMEAWDEMFPLRGGNAGEVRYRSWRWGAHLECFLLDCRRFRSANGAPDILGKTMLGDTQRVWLLDGIVRSTATFKVILTSVPLDFGDGDDHWAAFTTERDALLRALVGVPGVVFISGDQHVFAAHRHTFGVREFQVGPLARGVGFPQRTADGVMFRAARYNFALLDADAERLVVSGVGAGGEVFYREELTVADLTPAAERDI